MQTTMSLAKDGNCKGIGLCKLIFGKTRFDTIV